MGLLCNTLGCPPPCGFYGIGWGLIIWNSMELFCGPCDGIPWTCIGAAHWAFHGSAPWLGHWDVCMGLPMALHWHCSIRAPWKWLMGNTLGIPHVASMGLDGD